MTIPSPVHIFMYNNTPRYTLFSLQRITIGFDAFKGELYWQGLVNYGLWVLSALLFLIVLVTIYGLYIKATCLERPATFARRLIKSGVSSIGIICFKLSLLALVGLLMAYYSWQKVNTKDNTVFHSICPCINILDLLPTSLTSLLLNGDSAGSKAATIAAAMGVPDITTEVQKIDTYIASLDGAIAKLTPTINNTTQNLKDICKIKKKSQIKLPGVKLKGHHEFFIAGLTLCFLSMVLSFLIIKAISFRSTVVITIIAVLAWFTLVIWGVVASMIFIAFLTLTDFCCDPIPPAEEYLPTLNADLSRELVGFYLACKYENPLEGNLLNISGELETMVADADSLAKIFDLAVALKIHGKFARDAHELLLDASTKVQDLINLDCSKSQEHYELLLVIPCRNLYWSLGTLFIIAVLLTIFLALFIMITMRIRHFVTSFTPPKQPGPPSDVCPQTCPGPESDSDTPLYFLPEVKKFDTECPPSCKAFPAVLRIFTWGLNRQESARAEQFACDPECRRIYYDQNGYLMPPECIPVKEKAVETKNAYMCNQTSAYKWKMHKNSRKSRQNHQDPGNPNMDIRMEIPH